MFLHGKGFPDQRNNDPIWKECWHRSVYMLKLIFPHFTGKRYSL